MLDKQKQAKGALKSELEGPSGKRAKRDEHQEKNINVYIPMFHSQQKSISDIDIVPEGCTLVKLNLCGIDTKRSDKKLNTIINDFYNNEEYLKNPKQSDLYRIFGIVPNILSEGEQYAKLSFSYNLFYKDEKEKYRMKMCPLKDFNVINYYRECQGIMKMNEGECNNTHPLNNSIEFYPNLVTFDQIRLLYSNSIFPSKNMIEDILNILDTKIQATDISVHIRNDKKYIAIIDFLGELTRLIEKIYNEDCKEEYKKFKKYIILVVDEIFEEVLGFNINLNEIMKDNPGVYYIITCRSYEDEVEPEDTRLQRQNSLAQRGYKIDSEGWKPHIHAIKIVSYRKNIPSKIFIKTINEFKIIVQNIKNNIYSVGFLDQENNVLELNNLYLLILNYYKVRLNEFIKITKDNDVNVGDYYYLINELLSDCKNIKSLAEETLLPIHKIVPTARDNDLISIINSNNNIIIDIINEYIEKNRELDDKIQEIELDSDSDFEETPEEKEITKLQNILVTDTITLLNQEINKIIEKLLELEKRDFFEL